MVEQLNKRLPIFEFVEHCDDTQCDIVFISVFGNTPPWKTKTPKCVILITGEHPNNHYTKLHYDYAMDYYDDTETSIYFPQWQYQYSSRFPYYNVNRNEIFECKDKFASFMTRHGYKPTCDLSEKRI